MSVKTIFHRDGFERWQDVEDILEDNKRLRNEPQDPRSSFRHIARTPCVEIERLLREQWAKGNVKLKWTDDEFGELIKRNILDNSDFRKFRTDK